MNQQGQRIYRLDGVEIDTAQLCLKRDGEEQHLRLKTFQVLIYLLEQRGRLVTKDELIEHIWPDTAVTDNTLEQCMAEIRKMLGDDSRHPRFIKTVPRAGYRFIGTVQEVDASATQTERSAIPVAAEAQPAERTRLSSRRSLLITGAILLIAISIISFYLIRKRSTTDSGVAMTLPQDPTKRPVMFFDNESGSAELDWLREGLADMMITDLSRSKNLAVLSRQQLHVLLDRIGHQEPEKIRLEEALHIARQAQAKILVLGSFAKLGEQIRIDVHVHDARDGQLLTAERLVVDQPAQILTQLDLLSFKLSSYIGGPKEGNSRAQPSSVVTNNLEAFRYYSLGVEKAQVVRNEEALALLQKAIALDPNFAMAYARIGYVYGVTGTSLDKAKPYLEKAFQLTDRLTEKDKLNIQAWYAIVNYDYSAAIDAFRRIVSRYPLEVEAYRRLAKLLQGEEKFAEAIEVLKQALVIDSGEKDLYNSLGSAYSEMGQHDEAIVMFQRYVQLAPDEPNAHDSLALGYQWAGRYDEAIAEYNRALQLKPDFEIARIHLGHVYFQQGRYRAALDEFQRLLKVGSTDYRGRLWALIAYVELERGNVSFAERDARAAARFLTPSIEMFFVATAKGDLSTARQLKEQLEQSQNNERGMRTSSRPMWFRRGLYALKSNSPSEAIEDFKEALKHRPQTWSIDAFEDCLGNAYLELGRLDEAIAEYERIVKLNPNYPLVHYHLAQVYEKRNQADLAQSEYDLFLRVWSGADQDVPEVVLATRRSSNW